MRRGTARHKRMERRKSKIQLFAAWLVCAVLVLGAAGLARAGKAAPEGCSLRQAKPAKSLTFPLKTSVWRVSDMYGWRKDPITGKQEFHRGVDLACAEGTPVTAAMDGVVRTARRSTSYGNYLRIGHADGQETLYAHLQYSFVRTGEVVNAGQLIGTAGQTGRATGAHLHFEFLQQDTRFDPSAALGLP